MTSFLKNSGKCKFMYGERSRTPAQRAGGVGGRRAGAPQGTRGPLGMVSMLVALNVVMAS